jgi:hypothetical protein
VNNIILSNSDVFASYEVALERYSEVPSSYNFGEVIQILDQCMQSLISVKSRLDVIESFFNTISECKNVLDKKTQQEIMNFVEKYALIFDLSMFFPMLERFLEHQAVEPWLPLRFSIYKESSVQSLEVITRMIDTKLNTNQIPFFDLTEKNQRILSQLYHIRAISHYKTACLLAGNQYRTPGAPNLSMHIEDLIKNSNSDFKEAWYNGNYLAHAQRITLRDFGCFGTLPSLNSSAASFSYRLISAMQLHILSNS